MTLSRFLPAWPEGAYALRLVVAAVLALWAGSFLPGGHAFSAVISALLVVRPYQQGALKAGALRLLATAGGIALAFAAQYLHRFGLNDYIRLLLALGPLSLLAAYNSSYRTALIAAVLMLAAPTDVGAVDAAAARAMVVTVGAVIGTVVSVVVLPAAHRHVVADKALKILVLMVGSLAAAEAAPTPAGDKAESKLRKALLELSQMAKDNSKNHRDDDPSGQIVRLLRHAQAVIVLLRGRWRKTGTDAAFCDTMLAVVADLQKRRPVDTRGLYAALPDSQPDGWLMRTLANDITALAKLCVQEV